MKRETFFVTDNSQTLIDRGTSPGGGQSSRMNGILERYEVLVREVQKDVSLKFHNEIPKLINEYPTHGKPGPWILDYALGEITKLQSSKEKFRVANIADLSPFHKKLAIASSFELLILEEIIAREVAITIKESAKEISSKDIQALRVRLGMLQKEIASLSGISPRHWQRFENDFEGTNERNSQPFDPKLFDDLSDPFMITPIKEHEKKQKKPRLYTKSKVIKEIQNKPDKKRNIKAK